MSRIDQTVGILERASDNVNCVSVLNLMTVY